MVVPMICMDNLHAGDIMTVGLSVLKKAHIIHTQARCTRLKCPRLDCPPACKYPIRIISTPYRFIP